MTPHEIRIAEAQLLLEQAGLTMCEALNTTDETCPPIYMFVAVIPGKPGDESGSFAILSPQYLSDAAKRGLLRSAADTFREEEAQGGISQPPAAKEISRNAPEPFKRHR